MPDPSAGELPAAAMRAAADLKLQKDAARLAGDINGMVTIFVGRISHRLPVGAITAGELKRRLRCPESLRLAHDLNVPLPIDDDEELVLAGGEGFCFLTGK